MTKEERNDAIEFFKKVAEKEVNNAKYSKLAIEALKQKPSNDMVSCGVFEQAMWERDVAITQLKELGYGLGEKIKTDKDAISRQAALKKLKESAEHHANDSREEALLRRDRDIIRALPPVTPQPKIGRWVLKQRDKYIDINCSECSNTRFKDYAYGYTVDELNLEEVKDFIAKNRINYCECCGIKMQEVEE